MADEWEVETETPASSGGGQGGWEVADETPAVPTWTQTGVDVAKQIPTALATGTEALVTGPAQLLGLAGRGLNAIGLGGNPEAEAQQQKMRELAAQQGGSKGIAQYLPEPETKTGQFARTAVEFVPGAGRPANIPIALGAGLASEAAGQATAGTPLEGVARVAGAFVPSGAYAGARKAIRNFQAYRGAPIRSELEQSVNDRYTYARGLGVELNPTSVSKGLATIKKEIDVHPDNAPQTFKFLSAAQSEHAPVAPKTTAEQLGLVETAQKQGVTFDKLEAVRRDLGDLANKLPYGDPESRAARQAQQGIDRLFASVQPQDVIAGDARQLASVANLARQEAAANFRMRAMEALLQRAEDKAAKDPRAVERIYRNELAAFVRPNRKGVSPAHREGFNRQEIEEMRRTSKLGTMESLLRTVGIAGGYLGMAGLGGASLYTHDPSYGGMAAIGYGARKLGGVLARSRADRVARMAASRSPLAQERGVVAPPPAPSWLPSTLAIGRGVIPSIENARGFKHGGRVTKSFRFKQ